MLTQDQITENRKNTQLNPIRLATLGLIAFAAFPSLSQAQAPPVFEIFKDQSTISFKVKGSVEIDGTFKQWDASVVFATADAASGVLNIEIQAASVDTGSGMKDGKLKGKDFFDVADNPVISFKSTQITKAPGNEFDFTGNFTIRGVTKPQVLKFIGHRAETGATTAVQGTMFFDRKDFGINGSIPFLKIADRVEVTVNLKGKRVSGTPLIPQP